MGKITRRLLLGTAGTMALAVVAAGASRIGCRFVPRNHPDFFSLLDMAPDDAAAREIGRLALASLRLPSDLAGVETALLSRPLTRAAFGETCPTARNALVQDQCAVDFAEGRVVSLDGWILSETEAAMCAGRALRSA